MVQYTQLATSINGIQKNFVQINLTEKDLNVYLLKELNSPIIEDKPIKLLGIDVG